MGRERSLPVKKGGRKKLSAGDYDDVTLGHIATQPVRYRLLKAIEKRETLEKGESPLYIKQLSDVLDKLDRKIVAFHLNTLEEYGLITTHLKTEKPKGGNPVVVREAELTDKGRDILSKCNL